MRLVAPDYLPNEMDVLRARTKTTGIYETRFQMGQLSIQYVCVCVCAAACGRHALTAPVQHV